MIAYYGQIKFEALAGALSSAGRRALLLAAVRLGLDRGAGQGKLLLGDRGFDVNSFDLEDGNLTVRAANLLGFAPRWRSSSRSSRAS